MTVKDSCSTEEVIPCRVKPIIFMINTSGGTEGVIMATINKAIPNAIRDVANISCKNTRTKIKIGVLGFSSGANWMYDKFIEVESFQWKNLYSAFMTAFGEACCELSQIVLRGWVDPQSLYPTIILLSRNSPTDNWEYGLKKLKDKNWFKAAYKIAIAIGDYGMKDHLIEFTDDIESVITVHNPEQLEKTIHLACKVAAHDPIRQLHDEIQNDSSLKEVGFGVSEHPEFDDWGF